MNPGDLPPADVLPAGPISPRSWGKPRLVHGLLAPMRDGTVLAMDLIRPDAPGRYPVVLVRTPYDKTRGRARPSCGSWPSAATSSRSRTARGRFNSDGDFFPYTRRPSGRLRHRRVDGRAGVVRRQRRHGRRLLRRRRRSGSPPPTAPPHLKAIVPSRLAAGRLRQRADLNGCFLLPMGEWMVWMGRRSWQTPADGRCRSARCRDYFDALPLAVAAGAGRNV